jgi:predicted ABC-type ATPase
MDRTDNSFTDSLKKDNCHWFVNGQELDAQSGQSDKGEAQTLAARLKTLSRCMSVNKHKAMTREYLAERQAEKQAEQSKDNELAA